MPDGGIVEPRPEGVGEKPSAHDDVISQTRKELEELDDLDV